MIWEVLAEIAGDEAVRELRQVLSARFLAPEGTPWSEVEELEERALAVADVLAARVRELTEPEPKKEYIKCPRCEGQTYDRGSCSLCSNVGWLDKHGDRLA